MNINRRIILHSEDEDNSAMKGRRIEVESSPDQDIVTENLDSVEKSKGKYLQHIKLCEILYKSTIQK